MARPGAVRDVGPVRVLALAAVAWLVCSALAASFRHSGNVWSRFMTIESIVERGTLVVGRSPLLAISGSPDVAKFRGKLYSDKPPVLPALGVLVYGPMYLAGVKMSASPGNLSLVNWALVGALVSTGVALSVAGVRILLSTLDLPGWVSDLLAMGAGAGTLLLTYGVTFNNHAPAAGCLTMATALVVTGSRHGRRVKRTVIAGLLAGLAAAMDLPAGFLVLAGLGAMTLPNRWEAASFAMGASGPLALHAALQSMVTGSPLPVEFYPEALAYPGSYWATEAGQFREQGSRLWFLAEILLGPQGWITVTPLVAPGLVAAARAIVRERGTMRGFAMMTVVSAVVLVGYYVFIVRRTDFAGQSFGTRHLLPITPLVYFWACVPLSGHRWRLYAPLFAVLWGVGAVYAFEGQKDPWSRIERRTEPVLVVLRKVAPYPYSSYDR